MIMSKGGSAFSNNQRFSMTWRFLLAESQEGSGASRVWQQSGWSSCWLLTWWWIRRPWVCSTAAITTSRRGGPRGRPRCWSITSRDSARTSHSCWRRRWVLWRHVKCWNGEARLYFSWLQETCDAERNPPTEPCFFQLPWWSLRENIRRGNSNRISWDYRYSWKRRDNNHAMIWRNPLTGDGKMRQEVKKLAFIMRTRESFSHSLVIIARDLCLSAFDYK